jgi:hypothetical protein
VVLPLWFLSGPPWWYSCHGFSLALRDGTTYLALFVISGWPFLMVPMVLPYGPSLALLHSVSLAVPRSPSSWYLPPLSYVPTFYLPLTFSVSLCCSPLLSSNATYELQLNCI